MDRVFSVYAWRADAPETDRRVFLELPVLPYELRDALDRLRADDETPQYAQIEEYLQFPFLSQELYGRQKLCELNGLAQRLAGLNPEEAAAFQGLVKVEDKPVSLERLTGLSNSIGCCYVVGGIRNDRELGRFYAENGFIPGVEDLPDELFDLLDFERIGREQRQQEGGIFAEGCYVVRHSEIAEVHTRSEPFPEVPDYTILLEASTDSGEAVRLKLPAEAERLEKLTQWDCLDCSVPMLREALSAETDVHAVNRMAERLQEMTHEELAKYKALLEILNCREFQGAEQLSRTMGEYLLTANYQTPAEIAKGELTCILDELDMGEMLPYLDLNGYGQALLDRRGGVLSGYGLVERADGEPVLTMQEPLERGLTM